MHVTAYEKYAESRHRLPSDADELSRRHELYISAALELFDDVAAFAASDKNARLYDGPSGARRVEIDLEGGLFAATHTARQDNWHEVVTGLATHNAGIDEYDVVKHVFSGIRRTLLSAQFFRTASPDPEIMCDRDAIVDSINAYDMIGITLRNDQPYSPLSIPRPVVGMRQAYYDNLRPSESHLRFPAVQSIVSHRICETIDLMAGFAGRRN